MGAICPCICPRRRKAKQFAYDVHEQTFEIEQNGHGVGEISPKNGSNAIDSNILTEQLRSSNSRSDQHEEEPIQHSSAHSFPSEQQPTKKQRESEILVAESASSENVQAEKIIQKPQQEPPKRIEEPSEPPQSSLSSHILKPKAPRKKYNPDDYRYLNEKSVFKVRKIDSIKEQQYNIDGCSDSVFFIFDITANVYIDDTQNCFIFVAPCESTIFIRNCKNVTLVAVTGQFRTYNCHNCRFSLYCKSQPVIESSSGLTFSTFACPVYEQLPEQLKKKRFQKWNNHWSEIHNFTKKEGEIHYKLEEKLDLTEIGWEKAFEEAELKIIQKQNLLPFIIGELPYEIKREVLIIVDASVKDDKILQVLEGAKILKGYEGPMPGEGKKHKKIILIDILDYMPEKYEELGKVLIDSQQIEQNKAKYFISFGDERAK